MGDRRACLSIDVCYLGFPKNSNLGAHWAAVYLLFAVVDETIARDDTGARRLDQPLSST